MKFTAKPWKAANSYVITIPSDFVKHGIVDASKEYEVELKEVDQQ